MILQTLTVFREWQSAYNQITILKDCNNKVKAIIPSSIRQPKMNQKTIVINCWSYLLDWDIVAREKKLKKQKYDSKNNSYKHTM
jgi:hypothetical protein